jgi:hypothetical protein
MIEPNYSDLAKSSWIGQTGRTFVMEDVTLYINREVYQYEFFTVPTAIRQLKQSRLALLYLLLPLAILSLFV